MLKIFFSLHKSKADLIGAFGIAEPSRACESPKHVVSHRAGELVLNTDKDVL